MTLPFHPDLIRGDMFYFLLHLFPHRCNEIGEGDPGWVLHSGRCQSGMKETTSRCRLRVGLWDGLDKICAANAVGRMSRRRSFLERCQGASDQRTWKVRMAAQVILYPSVSAVLAASDFQVRKAIASRVLGVNPQATVAGRWWGSRRGRRSVEVQTRFLALMRRRLVSSPASNQNRTEIERSRALPGLVRPGFKLRPMAECVRESTPERNLDGVADDMWRKVLSPVWHTFRTNKEPTFAKAGRRTRGQGAAQEL